MHIWFPQILVLLWKRSAAPLRPPKIIYFCKFRLKRVWNYAYLACKIQHFLRQGGRGPATCTPREHLAHRPGKNVFFPCKLGKISLQQGRFPSSVGWFPLCISLFFPSKSQDFPARSFPFCLFFQGLLAQALGLLTLRRSWATNVENLPELMLYSLFYVPYLCGTHWLCMTSTLSCMKYEKCDYVILKYQSINMIKY